MRELEGKVAIVTGASRGIGEATAERLASAGATVIAAARSIGDEVAPKIDTLAWVVAQIRKRGDKAYAFRLDMADPTSRAAFMDAVFEQFGSVDILVNNAGIAGYGAVTWKMPDKHFRRVFEVDVFGPRDLITRALPGMLAKGRGHIVNVSTTVADRAAPNYDGPPFFEFHRTTGIAAYASAKSALNLFTRSLAAELHGMGIAANTVAPVNSVMTRSTKELLAAGVIQADRIKAPEDPETMAEAILALCLVDPDETTGRTLYSGQYLAEINRPVRGRDGGEFNAMITVNPVSY